MYDSRSSHARKPRSAKALSKYLVRRDQEADGAYFLPRPVSPSALLIDEGLAELAMPVDLDETYVRECDFDYFVDEYVPPTPHEEPLAEWEWELLGGSEGNFATYAEYVADHERKAREPRLAWSSDIGDVTDLEETRAWEEMDREVRAREEAAYDGAYGGYSDDEDVWLAPVTSAELFDLFPGGGFTVESARTYEPSGKAHAHMRVYELAREVGIDSRHMVEYLRVYGEWVANHTAYVALPVCEAIIDLADDLRAEYGERTPTPKTWGQTLNEWKARLSA